MSYKFSTLIYKGEKFYVAECLELGVVSQGENPKKAIANLREAVELYLEDEPVEILPIENPKIGGLKVAI